jgi:hypothetical protein
MTTAKMTNVKALDYVLTNCELPTDVAEKLEKMKVTFEKKNSSSSGEKKPTATQVANMGLKEQILDFLGTLPVDSDGVTCTEIQKAIPELGNWQVQKTAQLMIQLGTKGSGQVISRKIDGKSLFKLA